MGSFGIVILIVYCIVCGCFCYFVAQEKNRNDVGWFCWGLLFGIIALLAIAGVPSKKI